MTALTLTPKQNLAFVGWVTCDPCGEIVKTFNSRVGSRTHPTNYCLKHCIEMKDICTYSL